MRGKQALLVMPRERRLPLQWRLDGLRIETLAVANCREARRLLETRPPLDLVITAVSLADGNWCDLLRIVVEEGVAANVLVASASRDERLRPEVLGRGGCGVLAEPYERRSVEGVLRGALGAAGAAPAAAAGSA